MQRDYNPLAVIRSPLFETGLNDDATVIDAASDFGMGRVTVGQSLLDPANGRQSWIDQVAARQDVYRALLSAIPHLTPGARLDRVTFDASQFTPLPLREHGPGHFAAV